MAKPTLYGPDGQPIRREDLTREVAGPTLTGVRSPIAAYPADGLTPSRLATIMKAADAGDPLSYFELAEQIEERDLHYVGVLGTRKRSVSQIAVRVEAASESAEHVGHADMIRQWLTRDELQEELFDILDAIGKGISFTEIMWDTSEGQWRPGTLKWRDPRWFTFDRLDLETPLIRDGGMNLPLPPMKFIVARFKAKSGLAIRSGIARAAAWAWMFKAFTQKDWAIFSQVFGQPVRVGKYQPGASDKDKDSLFRAVANIAADCAAIIPATMAIDFIESKTTQSSGDLYKARCDWLDQQVSKAVLGQTTTTDAISGGHAVSQEHRQVQEDIEASDAKQLAAVLNRHLIRPWIDLEYGPQKAYPKIIIEDPDETDLTVLSDALTKLVPMGLKVSMASVRDKVGLPEPDAGEDVLVAPAQQNPDPVPLPGKPQVKPLTHTAHRPDVEFHMPLVNGGIAPIAVRPARDAIDDLGDQALLDWQPLVDPVVKQVEDLISQCATLEEFMKRLPELARSVDTDALTEALSQASFAAKLAGLAGMPLTKPAV